MKCILTLASYSTDDLRELKSSSEPVTQVSISDESMETLKTDATKLQDFTEDTLEVEDSSTFSSSPRHETGITEIAYNSDGKTTQSSSSVKREVNQNESNLSAIEEPQDSKSDIFLKDEDYEDQKLVSKDEESHTSCMTNEKLKLKEKREISNEDDIENVNDQPLQDEVNVFEDFRLKYFTSDIGSLFGDLASMPDEAQAPDIGETNTSEVATREKRLAPDCSGCQPSAQKYLRGHGRFKRRLQMGFLHRSDPSSKAIKGKKPKIDRLFQSSASQIRRSDKRKSG